MVERLNLDSGPKWAVSQNQVHLLACELSEKVLHDPVLAADEMDRLSNVERRFQELLHKYLGHRIGDADGETERSGRCPSLQRPDEVLTYREDFVGVPEDVAAIVGQNQAPTNPVKQ